MTKAFFVASAVAVGCLATAWVALPASAGMFDARADEPGRYTMQAIEGGFLRLDTQTGAVSVCSGNGGDWSCAPAADDRSSLEDENARLRAENADLRAQIVELGATPDITTPEDVDAAMDVFESVAERFGRIVKIMRQEMEELDQEIGTPENSVPAP